MRGSRNIHEIMNLGVDWIGFDFNPKSERYVRQVSSQAGIIPDYGTMDAANGRVESNEALRNGESIKLCGVFKNDMPQNIITRVVNFHLDIVQLNGEESSIMIDNLRRTIDPDIHPGLKVMKKLSIRTQQDVLKYKEYEHTVDYFLFELYPSTENLQYDSYHILDSYEGNVPFLIGGNITPKCVNELRTYQHPQFLGINLNEQVEDKPALKNIDKLSEFVSVAR